MFKHIYFNSLKIYIREKTVVFWLLVFPMILAIFFKVGFAGLTEGESFEAISVAVVENSESTEMMTVYKGIFEGLSDMFHIRYTDKEEAEKLLLDEDITAYIYMDEDKLAMTVKESGLNQSITKSVLDKINEGVSLVMSGKVNPENIEEVMQADNVLNDVKMSEQKQDFIAAWFYTILGMAAMYGSMLGVTIIKYIQANQSAKAMRVNLAPVSKMRVFSAMFAAGATLHSIIMVIIYLYLRYVMNINFGDRQGYIILTSVIGGITGISIGALISVIVKAGENFKIGVCMAVSMAGSYLAGMMDNFMKYKVMQNAPVIEYINPAGILTDSYLKLFYYEDLGYYMCNLMNLIIIMAVCMAVTIFILRRQKYDSI